jgi:hypothetical protein
MAGTPGFILYVTAGSLWKPKEPIFVPLGRSGRGFRWGWVTLRMARRGFNLPLPTVSAAQAVAGSVVAVKGDSDPEFRALLATGASKGEALGMLAGAMGEACYRPLWERWSRHCKAPAAITRLKEVAIMAPVAANTWLNCWLAGKAIEGDLDLAECRWCLSLPEGLDIGGYLILSGSGIAELPKGLKVHDCLQLDHTPITSLPEDLAVGRHIWLQGSRIATLPQGLKVKGNLDLKDAPITRLPDGLVVEDGLYLRGSQVVALPKGLKVGILNLEGCRRWDGCIPRDAHIARIFSDRYSNGISLASWREFYPKGDTKGER